jgi:GxxExxY protein
MFHLNENELSKIVIGLAIEVHNALGPGLLERIYLECLCYKLEKYGFRVEREKSIPIYFEDIVLECGYRIDILVENKLVIELKSVEKLSDIHLAQTLTYIRLGNFKLGLLINFNEVLLKNGIRRVVNGLEE